MLNVFIWVVFGIFLILIVSAALAMFCSPDSLIEEQENSKERKLEEEEIHTLRSLYSGIVAGRALSERDYNKFKQFIDGLEAGDSFLCVASRMVYILEECPTADWSAISFRVKSSHKRYDELRGEEVDSGMAANISTCFAGCDSLMYVLRQKKLLV